MQKDAQHRKYQLTVNNPAEKGFSHDTIRELLQGFKSLAYFCMADEQGNEEHTLHTHIFTAFNSPVRFSTLKNRFPEAHIEAANGTSQENRDYVNKSGKWENDEKHGTKIEGTFEEWGNLPEERQGFRTDCAVLLERIKDGASNYELLDENPDNMMHLDKIEKTRQIIRNEEFKDTFRQLEVHYIWGATGVGKTRYVMEKYGYSAVYRVTDYKHPFDLYKGEDVLLFDEFRSQLPISDLLNYLDGYPQTLPCRYANKQACYTKVYLLSNVPLESQYAYVQREQPATWAALQRRIQDATQFPMQETEEQPAQCSFDGEFIVLDDSDIPGDFLSSRSSEEENRDE